MNIRTSWAVLMLFGAASVYAQQSIYWKKDHIYAGPSGKEIAIVTPAATDQIAPTAPTGLVSSNVTATSVQLNWSASTDTGGSNLAGYKIYRQVGTGASLPVGSVGPASLSFADQHLQPNTVYTFRIVAFDGAQNQSSESNAITVATLSATMDTTAPEVPRNVAAVYRPLSRNVRLDWFGSTDSGGSGLTGYRVYRGGTLVSGALPIANNYFEETGLGLGLYSYTVAAVDNASNVSAQSSAATVGVPFQDDFTAPNGNLPSPWVVTDNNPQISSNAVRATTPTFCCWVWNSAVHPTTVNSFKASSRIAVQVPHNERWNAAGLMFYRLWDPSTSTYSGYRAYVYTIYEQIYLELDYAPDLSTGGGTNMGAVALPYPTGVISVETDSVSGNVKVFFDGALLIQTTLTPSRMTGQVGISTAFQYFYFSTIDDFYLMKN